MLLLRVALACGPDAHAGPPAGAQDSANSVDTADTAGPPAGDTADSAAPPSACGSEGSARRWCTSCKELLAVSPGSGDGPATLQMDGVSTTFDTLCEMDLAGGGWTLVGTNSWAGGWTEESVLNGELFGTASLTDDYKGAGFSALPFTDLLFENDTEHAAYDGVGDGLLSYLSFQDTIPIDNCGIDTPYSWQMTEGTFEDPDLCETTLYINVKDWEGGLIPCGDSESAPGPAWSTQNKDLGCPLNDPLSSCFAVDYWDYNPWGDHVAETTNLPLRMWAR